MMAPISDLFENTAPSQNVSQDMKTQKGIFGDFLDFNAPPTVHPVVNYAPPQPTMSNGQNPFGTTSNPFNSPKPERDAILSLYGKNPTPSNVANPSYTFGSSVNYGMNANQPSTAAHMNPFAVNYAGHHPSSGTSNPFNNITPALFSGNSNSDIFNPPVQEKPTKEQLFSDLGPLFKK
jgi:hypothetical protein